MKVGGVFISLDWDWVNLFLSRFSFSALMLGNEFRRDEVFETSSV